MGDFQNRYDEDLGFLGGTNENSSQMTFKGEVVHDLWALGKGTLIWCEKWKGLKVLVHFQGDYEIQWFLMEDEGWDRSIMTYEVRADGSWWHKVTILRQMGFG